MPRLPLYPEHVAELERWVDPAVAPHVVRASDALGLAREDRWAPGEPVEVPFVVRRDAIPLGLSGEELDRDEIVRLLSARGEERERVLAAGRELLDGLRGRGDARLARTDLGGNADAH